MTIVLQETRLPAVPLTPGRAFADERLSTVFGPSDGARAQAARFWRELDPADAAAVADWLSGTRSRNTRTGYARDLRDFAAFAYLEGVTLLGAHRVLVSTYFAVLIEQGKSAEVTGFFGLVAEGGRFGARGPASSATLARARSALSSFYRLLVDTDVLPKSPVVRVDLPPLEHKARPALRAEDVARCLAAAAAAGPRDHALVGLMGLHGLRVGSVVAARVEGLGHRGRFRTLTVPIKGARTHEVPLRPELHAAVDAVVAGRTSGPLFMGTDGQHLTTWAADRVVGRIGKAAGVPQRVRSHDFRHALVTIARDNGAHLEHIADTVAHRDVRTTAGYDTARRRLDRDVSAVVVAALPSLSGE